MYGIRGSEHHIVPDDPGLPEFQNDRATALLFGSRWQVSRDSLGMNLLANDIDTAHAAGG